MFSRSCDCSSPRRSHRWHFRLCGGGHRYKEHTCKYIFRFDDLDLGAVARSFALLKLPNIKEFRFKKASFEEAAVDTSKIPFLDKHREKERQKKLVEIRAQAEATKVERTAQKRDKEKAKKRALDAKEDKHGNPVKRKRKGMQARMMDEWERLSFEENLAKKLRRGKISQAQFEAALRKAGADSEAEDDEYSDDDE